MIAGLLEQLLPSTATLAVYLSTLTLPPVCRSQPPEPMLVAPNRTWETLKPERPLSRRLVLQQAAAAVGERKIVLAGVRVDGPLLAELGQTPLSESLLRATRERLKLPVDLDDLLYFVDDLLTQHGGWNGHGVWLPAPRSRSSGVLLHPDDVFAGKPRRYGEKPKPISVARPVRATRHAPAGDGELLGPRWWGRFRNPEGEAAMLDALEALAPGSSFGARVRSLLSQLREQGIDVALASTVRLRQRGYLMWGAFLLSQVEDEAQAEAALTLLDSTRDEHGLAVPIIWRHPDGWQATVAAATEMVEAFDVVYATRQGALKSDHYDGRAIDIVATGLPRQLVLRAPDGARRAFDLSAPDQSRDLNLTPVLVRWIERHFGLKKLRADYPHWSDALPPPTQSGASRSTTRQLPSAKRSSTNAVPVLKRS